jgi:hypothetical protein
MDVALTIITQGGVTCSDWCALADTCEQSGVTTLFAADHYLSRGDELGNVAHDAWTNFTETRLVGTVEDVAHALLPYPAAGADWITIMHIRHTDLDSVRLIGERLRPLLEASLAYSQLAA